MLKKNTLSLFLILLINLFFCVAVSAQKIKINTKNQPLSEVLIEMGKNYDVQFSFNDLSLSQCFISDNKTYDSPEQAIKILVRNCQLAFMINEGVFVIYDTTQSQKTKINKTKIIKGKIVDEVNKEALPFSNIKINSTGITTDVGGNFSYKCNDSILRIKVSHVGYYLMDTIIYVQEQVELRLTPSVIGLEEFIIESKAEIERASCRERV